MVWGKILIAKRDIKTILRDTRKHSVNIVWGMDESS